MFFSVIVPVYGVEKYLRECVDSILSQDFADFELVLVDDGSPDACPKICDEYAAKDGRVKVIHKENGGLVSARQTGIEAAAGDYIINVDGDDSVRDGYFAAASKIIEEYDPDVITFAINYAYEDGRSVCDAEPVPVGLYRGKSKRTITDKMLLTPDMKHMHYYVWGKVFRRGTVKAHQAAVNTEISMGEDVCCLIPTYFRAESIYVSDVSVYNCRCRAESMSRKFDPNHFLEIVIGANLLERSLAGASADITEQIDRYAAFMCFVLLCSAAEAGYRGAADTLRKMWKDGFEKYVKKARFDGITVKSRTAMFLLKSGRINAAYDFLRFCQKIKR